MSETEILVALSAALATDGWTKAEHGAIAASFVGGVLHLRGRVESIGAKRRAAVLAKLLAHDHKVEDCVRCRAAVRRGDDDLARAAAERLAAERMFHRVGVSIGKGSDREVLQCNDTAHQSIVVSAVKGCVTLSGSVQSVNHSRLAEVLVWWLDGCERIGNELSVDPPADDNDDELNDAVWMTLEKDPLVNATQLHVATAAGIVQLEGLAANDAQRQRALDDVWLVPGVWDIDDKLQTAG